MATLKDVARLAGVSTATVSCCFSGKKNVRPKTRARIQEAADQLKYIPNYSARNLRSASSGIVGVLLPNVRDRLSAQILDGISRELQKNGYELRLMFSENEREKEEQGILKLIGENVDGLLIYSSHPENHDFFQQHILDYQIPVCFIERKPKGLNCDFAGFSYGETSSALSHFFREKQYRNILLLCGPAEYSPEEETSLHFQDSLFCSVRKIYTDGTREQAFQKCLRELRPPYPQIALATSEDLASGLLEVLHIRGIRLLEQMVLVVYGEESWNISDQIPGLYRTARQAVQLGSAAVDLLLRRFATSEAPARKQIMKDDCLNALQLISLPNAGKLKKTPKRAPQKHTLRLLMADIPTAHAIQELFTLFETENGVEACCEFVPQEETLGRIFRSMEAIKCPYDLLMYDVPWLPFLAQNQCLTDISSFVEDASFQKNRLYKNHMDTCVFEGGYYGIPLVRGPQVLFYRRDYFEDHSIQKAYSANHKISLRPPRTWDEFNEIAAFFTRRKNPLSPTEWGATLAGATDEVLAPEILIRLWALKGRLWDAWLRPDFCTEENCRTLEKIRDLLPFCEPRALSASIEDTVNYYLEGKAAMLITYSEYAGKIDRTFLKRYGKRSGFAMIPGRKPAAVGWNLGLHPFSEHNREAYLFLNWISRKDISYYLTILSGQSPATAPYRNQELQRLYPWLSLTEDSIQASVSRAIPSLKRRLVIPQNRIEKILCTAAKAVITGKLSPEQALKEAQKNAEHLFSSYGYPCRKNQ